MGGYKKAIGLMFSLEIALENMRPIACGYGARRECCTIKSGLRIGFVPTYDSVSLILGQASESACSEGSIRLACSWLKIESGRGPVLHATVKASEATPERTPRGAFSTTIDSHGFTPALCIAMR